MTIRKYLSMSKDKIVLEKGLKKIQEVITKTLGAVVTMDCCSPAIKTSKKVKKNNNNIKEKSSLKFSFPKLLKSFKN